MKSTIETTAEGLRIEATVPADQREALLQELGKCAGGSCSCPTPQYAKLSAIEVNASAEGVTVELKVKPGELVDPEDIRHCLDHTAKQVGA